MNNQQTTPQEYDTQAEYASLNSRFVCDQSILNLSELDAEQVLGDDHGMPFSGDHLSKTRLKMELNSLYGKNVN